MTITKLTVAGRPTDRRSARHAETAAPVPPIAASTVISAGGRLPAVVAWLDAEAFGEVLDRALGLAQSHYSGWESYARGLYAGFAFFAPDYMGHPDNYIPANPLVTPAHIVPARALILPRSYRTATHS